MIKDSDILKKAKQILEYDPWVCYAIQNTGMGTYRQRAALVKWVMQMIRSTDGCGEAHTYTLWLRRTHPEIRERMGDNDIYQAKLQWLDWMIAYCEAEEAKGAA